MKRKALNLSDAEWGKIYEHRERRVSKKEAAELGWKRVDQGGSKLRAVWEHERGWTLQHCGHPTALTPWDLHDPDRVRHLTGGLLKNIEHGTAWPNLAIAMRYVELVEKGGP